MPMTILTQDGELINYDYVKVIRCYSGEFEINSPEDVTKKKTVGAVQIVAIMDNYIPSDNTDDKNQEVILGFYEEEKFKNVIDMIKKWLNEKNDYHHLFVMPL